MTAAWREGSYLDSCIHPFLLLGDSVVVGRVSRQVRATLRHPPFRLLDLHAAESLRR